jgi:CheY-like chemotaxis protein
MLIDDNSDDNFFHERVIKKCDAAEIVIAKQSGIDALEYLKTHEDRPDIIFLDINMPAMNGWEFLQEYNKLEKTLQCKVIVVMLTTSENPDDKRKSTELNVSEFKTKPLTGKMLEEIILKYF